MHHCTGHGCRTPEGAACAAASARQLPAASGQLEVLWAQRPACATQGRRRARRPTSMLAPGSRCEPSAGTAPGWPAAAASPPCGVCCASGCGRAIPARRPSVTRPYHGRPRAWSIGSVRWTPCGCPQHDNSGGARMANPPRRPAPCAQSAWRSAAPVCCPIESGRCSARPPPAQCLRTACTRSDTALAPFAHLRQPPPPHHSQLPHGSMLQPVPPRQAQTRPHRPPAAAPHRCRAPRGRR